ncbi:MAG: diguanylate cyclase, partial [Methylococcaceae bacterium]|nr:diguanylate cyclase [Methylococcaceae bacterium]
NQLHAIGDAASALAFDAVGMDGARDTLLEDYKQQNKDAELFPAAIGTYKNIYDEKDDALTTLGKAGQYATEMVFGNLPMFIPSMGAGALGAIAARKKAEGFVADLVEKKMADGASREAAEKAAAEMVSKHIGYGAAGGAYVGSAGLETGSIYGDIYDKTGEHRPGVALGYGAIAGALDAIPAAMAVKRAFGTNAIDMVAKSLVARYGVEPVKQFVAEGGTELLQTFVEKLAVKHVDNKQTVLSQKDVDDYIDATLGGGVAGHAIGIGSQAIYDINQAGKARKEYQQSITEEALRALSPTGKLPMPMTPQEAAFSAKQKQAATGKPHVVVPHPAQPDKSTAVPESALQQAEQQVSPDDAQMLQQAEEFGQEVDPGQVDHFANGVTVDALDNFFADHKARLQNDPQEVKSEDPTIQPAQTVIDQQVPLDQPFPSFTDWAQAKGLSAGDDAAAEQWFTEQKAHAINQAAHSAATSPNNDLPEPTQSQKEAGNYQKGHVKIHGLDVAIENPQGSNRSGVDQNGEAWSVTLPNHYGYIKRTNGADGDQVDAYIGDNPSSDMVVIVDQVDSSTGKFDEHKIMLGFDTIEQAMTSYQAAFSDGKGHARVGSATPMTVDAFKSWLKDGDTKKPLAAQHLGEENGKRNVDDNAKVDNGSAAKPSHKPAGSDANGVLRYDAVSGAGQDAGMPGSPLASDAQNTTASGGSGNAGNSGADSIGSSIRPHVEALIKRRAAAGQITLPKAYDAIIAKAKETMKSGKGSHAYFKKMAKQFKGKDDVIHSALSNITVLLTTAKAPKEQKVSHDLIGRIKQLGGISSEYLNDIISDPSFNIRTAFKNGGTSPDDMLSMLEQSGFMFDNSNDNPVNQLRDAIQRYSGGQRAFKAHQIEAEAVQQAKSEQYDAKIEEANALGIADPLKLTEQELEDAIYEARDAQIMAQIDAADSPFDVADFSDDAMDDELVPSSAAAIDAWLGGEDEQTNTQGNVQQANAEGQEAGTGSNGEANSEPQPVHQEQQPEASNAPVDDRRVSKAERKRIAEMSPDEMRRELLTDHLTGIKNRRAYEESDKLPAQVSIDADSLKWINDNMGHDSGDKLLKTIAKALSEQTEEAYHISGDEFVVQAASQDEAVAIMDRVQERLKNAKVETENSNGEIVTVNGVGVSYGSGKTIEEAERGLQPDKQRREAEGLRASRGAEPPNTTRTARRGKGVEDQQNNPAGEFQLRGQTEAEISAAEQARREEIEVDVRAAADANREEQEASRQDVIAKNVINGNAAELFTLETSEPVSKAEQKRLDKKKAEAELIGQADLLSQPAPAKVQDIHYEIVDAIKVIKSRAKIGATTDINVREANATASDAKAKGWITEAELQNYYVEIKSAATTIADGSGTLLSSTKDNNIQSGDIFNQQDTSKVSQFDENGIIKFNKIPKTLKIANPATGKGNFIAHTKMAEANKQVAKLEALLRCLR